MVFWWQGKGFLTALIVVGSTIAVGMLADAIRAPSYTPWFWTAALTVAAPINWLSGRSLNRKRRISLGFLPPLRQLTYRAHHKFMSLPMESWSIAMAAGAAVGAISGALS